MTATLPSGPRLPTAVQTLLIGYVWDRWLASLQRRHGDVFTVRAIPFGSIVYFADPAAIKEIFTTPATTMHAGESNEVLSHVLGERSVLVIDEDEHLRARKAMLPHFHGDAVRAYAELIERLAEDELDSWPVGEPLRLHDRMRALTFEVILRAVFGVDDAARMTAMRDVLPDLVDLSGPLMLMFAWPQLGRIGPWRRWEKLKARADALVVDEIERRRRDPALEQRTDILSLLLRGGMQDTDDLRDQLVTLLLAGHETTATALAWSFERLMRTPAVHARAVEAARAGDDAYLDAVAQEALRVRPVIFDVVRKLAQPATIAGVDLPAGVLVAPGIGLVHRDPRRYPEPFAFRPERFLEGAAAPYTWIPFGGGVRRCVGAAFAQMEMRIVLRTVLRRAQLRAPSPQPERARTRHVTLVPSRGALAVVESREPRAATAIERAEPVAV